MRLTFLPVLLMGLAVPSTPVASCLWDGGSVAQNGRSGADVSAEG